MKKRLVSLMLALALTLSVAPALAYDLTPYKIQPDSYTVLESEYSANVITTRTYEAMNNQDFEFIGFTHDYAGENSSWMYPCLLAVQTYVPRNSDFILTSDIMPMICMRLCTSQAINFDSVSFIIDNTEYKVTIVGAEEATFDGTDYVQNVAFVLGGNRNGKTEDLVLVWNHLSMYLDMIEKAGEFRSALLTGEHQIPECKVVFHGKDEDVSAIIPTGFWTDIIIFWQTLNKIYSNIGEIVNNTYGAPCTMKSIK